MHVELNSDFIYAIRVKFLTSIGNLTKKSIFLLRSAWIRNKPSSQNTEWFPTQEIDVICADV
jgi:hypothetical protein